MQAILGKKIGMTQYITAEGHLVPVTALEAGPCVVTDVKNLEKHGYKAAQIGYGDNVKAKNVAKGIKTNLEKKKLPLKKWLREVRLTPEENLELGQEIKADIFKPGDLVDVQGRSIGKGFAGGVKRHHFRMQDATHGNSVSHRVLGSIGMNQTPGRVFKGKKMAGHLGDVNRTIQNLTVHSSDTERNLILIKGAVPGAIGGDVVVMPAVKARSKG